MAFSTQSDDGVVSDINITPLVDVMLVLLVVFIVTAPLLTNAIHVNLPKTTATSAPTQQKAVQVAIDEQGRIRVNERLVTEDVLEAELKALQANNPELALHLQADTKVSYGTVASVMASIEHAGISKLSVLTIANEGWRTYLFFHLNRNILFMTTRKFKVRTIVALLGVAFSPALLAQTQSQTAKSTAQGDIQQLDNVVVLGTRRADQTVLKSATPVEVISSRQLEESGAKNVAAALAKLVPSINFDPFSNSNNSGARPIQFRSLGPDEVLILVNGKRRHASAMLHGKASYGRGSQFVDVNNIPVSAISRIEVLRDGASAQYGSDAIAGVINIVLREADSGGELNVRVGEFTSDNRGGLEKTYSGWKGIQLGEDGFLTISAEWKDQNRTRNPYSDSRQQYFNGDPREATANRHVGSGGSADIDSKSFALNGEVGINRDVRLYSFLTYADRYSQAAGVWRRPQEDTNVRAIFPDGYAPELGTTSKDFAAALGVRFGDVDLDGAFDLSVNFGQNDIDQTVTNSVNASYGKASPTQFYLGKLINTQTNVNADYTKSIPSTFAVKPLTFGAGATARTESYEIRRGDPAGYSYGGVAILDGPNAGKPAAPGVQGFTAYQPQDEGTLKRNVYGGYLSLEGQLTDKFQAGIAGRAEHYSDFGWTATGKLSARYDFTPAVAIRGTASNGFRAPSVGQMGFSNTTVTWVGGTQYDTRIFPVNHAAAQALGAKPLDPENRPTTPSAP